MKKLLSLAVSALLVVGLFVGCSYKTDDLTEDKLEGTLITATAQWGGPKIAIDTDWTKLTIEFAAVPTNMQFVLNSDVTYQESWGPANRCNYAAIDKTTMELDLATILTDLKGKWSETTKVDSIVIQNTASSNACFIKSIKATKSDETTVPVTIPVGNSWENYTLTTFTAN